MDEIKFRGYQASSRLVKSILEEDEISKRSSVNSVYLTQRTTFKKQITKEEMLRKRESQLL